MSINVIHSDAGLFKNRRQESGSHVARSGLVLLGIALAGALGATLALRAQQPTDEGLSKNPVEQRGTRNQLTASRTEPVDYLSFSQLHFP